MLVGLTICLLVWMMGLEMSNMAKAKDIVHSDSHRIASELQLKHQDNILLAYKYVQDAVRQLEVLQKEGKASFEDILIAHALAYVGLVLANRQREVGYISGDATVQNLSTIHFCLEEFRVLLDEVDDSAENARKRLTGVTNTATIAKSVRLSVTLRKCYEGVLQIKKALDNFGGSDGKESSKEENPPEGPGAGSATATQYSGSASSASRKQA